MLNRIPILAVDGTALGRLELNEKGLERFDENTEISLAFRITDEGAELMSVYAYTKPAWPTGTIL